MSDLRVLSIANPAVTKNGGAPGSRMAGWGTPEGALNIGSQWDALVAAGKVYTALAGTQSSPLDGNDAYVITDPDLNVDVPDGTTIRPLFLSVHYESVGSTLLRENFASISSTLGAQSGGSDVTPINLRNRGGGGSNCTVTSAATVTAQSGTVLEFARSGLELDEAVSTGVDFPNRTHTWAAGKDGPAPILIGEGSLNVWMASQAASGFITLTWAEFQDNEY